MPRYPECVWSGAEELEHIEIVRRRGKVLENCGRCWKAWEIIGSCGRHWKVQKMSEASERVAGDREDFGRCV